MRLRFIWPGKTKDEHMRALVKEYLKRLSRFARCEVIEVREGAAGDRSAREKEARRIVEAIPERALAVLLDMKGQEWTSPELAEEIRRWENEAVKEVAIVIGGPEGVADAVASRAQKR